MEWKKFNTEGIKTPSEVINETLDGFTNATNGLLKLTLFEKSTVERLRSKTLYNFQYDLILHSQFMPNFKFDVFELHFDVSLYPCALVLEKGIEKELDLFSFTNNQWVEIKLEREEDLKAILEKIFKTKRFEEIVNGLMRISSQYSEDLPF